VAGGPACARARAELSRIRHETDKGTFVKPSDITVSEYLDEYLVGATRGRRESTKVSYREAFLPVRERLGNRNLQSITQAGCREPRRLDAHLRPQAWGQAWYGARSTTRAAHSRKAQAAFEMAVDEGRLVRNVVKLVTPPEYKPKERDIWSRAEVRKFLRTAAPTRLHAAWRLSLYGLRRGEVLGLRWSDIDLNAKPLTVHQARVLVDYKVRIEEPKSHNGKRTLPLDDDLVAALVELRNGKCTKARSQVRPSVPGYLTSTGTPGETSTSSPTNSGLRFTRSPTRMSSRGC
jgi:integrase